MFESPIVFKQTTTDMKKYTEIRNDYFDSSSNYWTIDAWTSDDDNEEGRVIAVVNGTTGDVWFIDNTCRNDENVLSAIRDVQARILNKKVITRDRAEGMLEGMLNMYESGTVDINDFNDCVDAIHKKYIVAGFDEEGCNDESEAWYDDIRADYC